MTLPTLHALGARARIDEGGGDRRRPSHPSPRHPGSDLDPRPRSNRDDASRETSSNRVLPGPSRKDEASVRGKIFLSAQLLERTKGINAGPSGKEQLEFREIFLSGGPVHRLASLWKGSARVLAPSKVSEAGFCRNARNNVNTNDPQSHQQRVVNRDFVFETSEPSGAR